MTKEIKEVEVMAKNKEEVEQSITEEVIQLESYISYELLEKKKKEKPNAKFILPNGKEAVLNAKQK
jgi:hypothetical protein